MTVEDDAMKRALALLVVLVLILGTVVPSDAWRGHGRGHFHHHRFHGGWWWPGAIVGGLVLGTVGAAVAASTYYPPVVYQTPPVVYESTPTYAPPVAAAPAIQREVVHPTGKYVLYGDGVTQPWQWVWVPNPPPPPAAPPAAPR
jgi:hypothetical protein